MVMVSNWSMVSALLVLVMCGDGLQFACYLSTLVGDILLVALSGNQVMPSDPWLPGLTWECFVFFNLPHPLVSPPSSCHISVFYYYLNSMVFSVFNISFSTFSIAYSQRLTPVPRIFDSVNWVLSWKPANAFLLHLLGSQDVTDFTWIPYGSHEANLLMSNQAFLKLLLLFPFPIFPPFSFLPYCSGKDPLIPTLYLHTGFNGHHIQGTAPGCRHQNFGFHRPSPGRYRERKPWSLCWNKDGYMS